jgi:hypothetical protein
VPALLEGSDSRASREEALAAVRQNDALQLTRSAHSQTGARPSQLIHVFDGPIRSERRLSQGH